jgi:hypothetical protein
MRRSAMRLQVALVLRHYPRNHMALPQAPQDKQMKCERVKAAPGPAPDSCQLV